MEVGSKQVVLLVVGCTKKAAMAEGWLEIPPGGGLAEGPITILARDAKPRPRISNFISPSRL